MSKPLSKPIVTKDYVLNTPVAPDNLPPRTNVVPGSYDRSNPALQSFKLYVFCKQIPHAPLGNIEATLLLTSGIKLPFLIDLTDLVLYIDGVRVAHTYTQGWKNNAATIKFKAPTTPGEHKGTFGTSYPVNLDSSSFTFTVSGVTGSYILFGTQATPVDSRDVTIIQVRSEPIISSVIQSTQLQNTSSSIGFDHLQAYSLRPPVPVGGLVKPAWFSFGIDAYHPAFQNITCELSFKDTSGTLQWAIPIRLPNPENNVVITTVPYSDWDDTYTLLKVLSEDIGWKDGTFTLTWEHLNGDTTPVALINFTVFAADPSLEQPFQFTDDQNLPIEPIMPVVWMGGKTYLTFWSDESFVSSNQIPPQ